MSLENLYFNLSTLQWVQSFDSPNQINPPTWGNGDARDFSVTFLRQLTARTVDVVQDVVSVQFALSDPAVPGTPLTSATAGTAVNNAFPFVINLTGGMATFMSGKTAAQNVIAEFRVASAAGSNRYGTTVNVRPQQISDVTADPASADRPLGKDEASGIYLPKQVPTGARMIWTDEETGQMYSVGFANGQFRSDLL
jgi:hypothetical protein